MIPQRKLGEKANEIKVGDVVELDDRTGVIRYIGSGRVQIDYNHRLASRTLVYDVNVVKKIESNDDKIKYLIKRRLPIEDEKIDRKSTRLNSSHLVISYAVFCLKKKK